ncbi:MAG: LysE family transporter [Negativicutes bacterium]|nr:LysE family transporter [Negativicutes bacterium]
METVFFLKGLLLGFSIAAPVGPIGVLCIRRTLSFGMLSGLATGLGTATADAVYGMVAAFGITAVADLLLGYHLFIQLIGGGFLVYLGYSAYRAELAVQDAKITGGSLLAAYVSAVFLTLTNPMTILSFAAIFIGLGVGGPVGSQSVAALLVLGVFFGSAVWWLILSTAASALRARLNIRRLQYINRLAAFIIWGFAATCFLSI